LLLYRVNSDNDSLLLFRVRNLNFKPQKFILLQANTVGGALTCSGAQVNEGWGIGFSGSIQICKLDTL
jgi:hypothetical protein